jgi:hypothetical protein
MTCAVIDTRAIEQAAQALVADAARRLPGVMFGLHARDHGAGTRLIVEVELRAAGPQRIAIIYDDGGPEQKILAELAPAAWTEPPGCPRTGEAR